MLKALSILAVLLYAADLATAQARSCLQSPDAPSDSAKRNKHTALYTGQQNFSMALLQAIQKATPNENIFFSPYSTYHALLLAYFGSSGNTQKELEKALRLEWAEDKDEVSRAYRLEKQLRVRRAKNMPLEFESADKIYFSKNVQLTSCMTLLFNEELRSLDFEHAAEDGRKEINSWVANITRNEIKEVLSPGDVDSQTQLVLVNAAYMKGKWASQFDPKDTTDGVFYSTPENRSFVKMMRKKGTYNLAIDERLGAYVLQMPYLTSLKEGEESEISMVIVLPPAGANNLEHVLTKLTADSLQAALDDSMEREIDIWLPRFAFEQRVELIPVLRDLGISSLFDHTADLTTFSVENRLSIGDAKHVSKIKVDEEGSTAASATVLFSFRSARPTEPTEFKCDHPFLFMIFDRKAKAILFTGIYRDPKTQS